MCLTNWKSTKAEGREARLLSHTMQKRTPSKRESRLSIKELRSDAVRWGSGDGEPWNVGSPAFEKISRVMISRLLFMT